MALAETITDAVRPFADLRRSDVDYAGGKGGNLGEMTAAGLPVGAQIIGPHAGDAKTLAIAQALDENVRGFVSPPPAG